MWSLVTDSDWRDLERRCHYGFLAGFLVFTYWSISNHLFEQDAELDALIEREAADEY